MDIGNHHDAIDPNVELLIIQDGRLPSHADFTRGTHIIRDPRDLIVSGYFYHLKTNEKWCTEPNPANTDLPPDTSYQDHLKSISLEEGIRYEMEHVSGSMISAMLEWNFQDQRVLELRFEDVLNQEAMTFERIFAWYGFGAPDINRAVRLAKKFSRRRVRRHLRNLLGFGHLTHGSRVSYWDEYFSETLKDRFLECFGDVLIRLGYESSDNW